MKLYNFNPSRCQKDGRSDCLSDETIRKPHCHHLHPHRTQSIRTTKTICNNNSTIILSYIYVYKNGYWLNLS